MGSYTHDILVEGPAIAAIRDGRTFRTFDTVTINTAAKYYYTIEVGDSPIEINRFHVANSSSFKVKLSLYSGSSFSAGTPLVSFNMNTESTSTSKTVVTGGRTVSVIGTEDDRFIMYGEDTIGSQQDIGDTQGLTNYRILAAGTTALLEFENFGTNTEVFFKIFYSEKNPDIN